MDMTHKRQTFGEEKKEPTIEIERIMLVGQAWACNVSFRVIMLFE